MAFMNPKTYEVEKDGQFTTVKTFMGPVGIVRGLFRIPGKYIPWVDVDSKTTMVNGNIKVTEVMVHLDLVKWCPVWNYWEHNGLNGV